MAETINQIADRFCKQHKSCRECSYGAGNELGSDRCLIKQLSLISYPFEVITDALVKWAEAHPAVKPKTYADDFLEKFPGSMQYNTRSGRCPAVCKVLIYGGVRPVHCTSTQCVSCWNAPIPQKERKDNGHES